MTAIGVNEILRGISICVLLLNFVVAEREIRVSESDYDRLSEGQVVQIKRTILNNPVRIIRVKFQSFNAFKVDRFEEGLWVQAYDEARMACSDQAREAEEKIASHLGKENFFDKALLDIEKLKTDEVTAKRIEKIIQKIIEAREAKKK